MLRRLLPLDESSVVIEAIHRSWQLTEVVPPSGSGQPLMLWFGDDAHDDPVVAYAADTTVWMHYLVVDLDLCPNPEDQLGGLALATEAGLLGAPIESAAGLADAALALGLIAAHPWSDDVTNFVTGLEDHDDRGVRASAELARQYAESLNPPG